MSGCVEELQTAEWQDKVQLFVDSSFDSVYQQILKRAEQGLTDAFLMFHPPYELVAKMGVYEFFQLWQEPITLFLRSIADVRITRFKYSHGTFSVHVEWS